MNTFLTPEPIVVEIRNAAGTVTVDLSDDVTTTTVAVEQLPGVSGFLGEIVAGLRHQPPPAAGATDDVRVDLRLQDSGTSVLIVDTDPARAGWRTSFAVTVTAPSRSGVRVQSQSADVRVVGTADRLDLRTASGDVVVGTVERGSLVQTASGGIRIDALRADAELRTASGDVAVEHSEGSLSIHSTSGDVRVRRATGDVFARSVSGTVDLAQVREGVVEATAVSGDLTVGIEPGALVRLDVRTVSGSTRNDFSVVESESELPPVEGEHERRLAVTCRTTSGDIRLRRASTVSV